MSARTAHAALRVAHIERVVARTHAEYEGTLSFRTGQTDSIDPWSLMADAELSSHRVREELKEIVALAKLVPDVIGIRDASIRVSVDPDGASARILLIPPIGGNAMTQEGAIEALRRHGVVHGIDPVLLGEALESELIWKTVANATQPLPGTPAGWRVVVDRERASIPSGAARVDFRSMASIRAIEPGALLAVFEPGSPGVEGRDVLGRAIKPFELSAGKPLTPGKGAVLRDSAIYSESAGELVVNNGEISVVPLRVVEGNVDFGTGNVIFPGNVFVKGSVLDGFVVEAAGDIEIRGSIDAARVKAGGSIRVAGGILTRESGAVVAGGDVHAKFIENSRVEARGDIRAKTSILHSEIDALGTVECGQTIGGGAIRAGKEIICRVLGSAAGARTFAYFGENFLLARSRRHLESSLAQLRDRLREIDTTIEHIAHSATDPGESRALTRKLATARKILETDVRRIVEERAAVIAEAAREPEGEVRVSHEFHPGVVLSSRGVERPIENLQSRARYRISNGKIELAPWI